jgi:methyltransferase family protein
MSPSDLLRLLHEESPYVGHDLDAHPPDMQGWGSTDPIFRHAINALRPKVIIEVGTWKGASAIHMGQVIRELGLETRIVCIDTWLGSPEHFLGQGEGWRESLRLRNGYPRLYFTFLTNVIQHRLTDIIIPLPATSENAGTILAQRNIRAELVYIDAAHEYSAVKRDLQTYWPLLNSDGVLIGDDYQLWPGVTQAATEFAKENRLPMASRPGKFLLSKNPEFFKSLTTSPRQPQPDPQ